MDALETKALMIRHEASLTLLKHGEIQHGWEALAWVVCPSRDVYDASMTRARQELAVPEMQTSNRHEGSPGTGEERRDRIIRWKSGGKKDYALAA